MASVVLVVLQEATVASSCGILLTFLLRKPLRRFFGPGIAYFLWLLVPASLLALLLPAPMAGLKALPVPLPMPSLSSNVALASVSSGIDWATWSLCTWGMGFLFFCLSLTRQQQRFVANLGVLTRRDGLLRAAYTTGCPAVVGFLRPTIVVPLDFDIRYLPEEQVLILAHERMHVRRGDLVVNAMWAVARCIVWFNPLTHVAARLVRFDQELACDAAVMRDHPHSRKPYANAMLRTQLADGALPLGCHWPSTHPLKERIMLLNQPPARGLRRAIGQVLVGTFVFMIGYGTWAVQSDAVSATDGARVSVADSKIRISADNAQVSGNLVRYSGNVILEILGHDVPINFNSHKATQLRSGGAVLEGDVRIEDTMSHDQLKNVGAHKSARKSILLEGNVQIEVDGRIFTTERAVMSARAIKMDMVEVLQNASSDTIPGR